MKTVAATVLVVIGAMGMAESALRSGRNLANNDVCYEIVDSWWEARQNQKRKKSLTDLDKICNKFSGNKEYCTSIEARMAGDFTDEELEASCHLVGAHSDRCIGNPCLNLNTGDCTIQQTGGACMWFTEDDVTAINQYWEEKSQAAVDVGKFAEAELYSGRIIESFGCNRNPCSSPANGKKECSKGNLDVPDIYSCTWCTGNKDAKLQGKGLGCQLTVSTTTAECAEVDVALVPEDSIYVKSDDPTCQCSDTSFVCKELVSARSDSFVRLTEYTDPNMDY